MKRREFFEKAGIGSAALVSIPVLGAADTRATAKGGKETHSSGHEEEQEHGHGNNGDVHGPFASATVSFGQWDLSTPLDRFPNKSDRTRNNHRLLPGEVTIDAGGAVNFIIAGFHLVLVYGDGVQPGHRWRLALDSLTGNTELLPVNKHPNVHQVA